MGKQVGVEIPHDDVMRILRTQRFQDRLEFSEVIKTRGTVYNSKDGLSSPDTNL